jgi:AraC-like DNA-binding protein
MRRRNTINTPAENLLRIGTVMGVPQTLRDLGLDPGQVLSSGGFDPGIFDDPNNRISFISRGRLMAHCTAVTNCSHFGLLAGLKVNLESLGLVGLLAKNSPDVASALNNLIRYFHLHGRGAGMHLQVQDNRAILAYQIHQSGALGNDQIACGAIAATFNILRELCGPTWKPTEVRLMQRKPRDIDVFRRVFKTTIQFNADQHALVFRASWLERSLPRVAARVRRQIEQQIDALAVAHKDNFPAQVRAVLHAALVNGDLSANRVAALFSIHPRTLNRRLQARGFGFQQLVDETRFNVAKQMLEYSDLPIMEIALMLNYADTRTFIRAFRRWSGTTPARWRAPRK